MNTTPGIAHPPEAPTASATAVAPAHCALRRPSLQRVHPRAPRVAPTCNRAATQATVTWPVHRIAPDGTPRKQQCVSVCARRARSRRRALVPCKRENALRNHHLTIRNHERPPPDQLRPSARPGRKAGCDRNRMAHAPRHTLRTHRRPQQVRNGVRPARARTRTPGANAATTNAPLRQPAKRHLAATCNILNPHTRNAPPASELEQAFAFRPQRHCNATACATVSVHAREIRILTATGAARPRATTNPEPERTIRT